MICRLCLIQLTEEITTPLFRNSEETALVKLIAKYIFLQLKEDDSISTSICHDCSMHLFGFHKFCKHVDEMQSTLQKEGFAINYIDDVERQPVSESLMERKQDSPLDIKDVFLESASPFSEPAQPQDEYDATNNVDNTINEVIEPGLQSNEKMDSSFQDEDTRDTNFDRGFGSDAYVDTEICGKYEPFKSTETPSTSKQQNLKRKAGHLDEQPLPFILTCSFFVVLDELKNSAHERASGGVIAECQICKMKIRGSRRVTSNFLQHLKIKHCKNYLEYLEQKKTDVVPSRSENKQRKFDTKVLKFVVATLSPLSIVENPAFVSLFENENNKVQSRHSITQLLDTKCKEMMAKIKSDISQTDYICCTADTWKSRRKTFFAYTCHWLKADFKRTSAALACLHLNGSYTQQRLPDIIREIHKTLDIGREKLTCFVTSNGNNLVREFKEHGIDSTSIKLAENEYDSSLDEETLAFQSITNQPGYSKHIHCVSKVLNGLAITDFIKALKKHNPEYQLHLQSMEKCCKIWSRCNRQKAGERVESIISAPLKTPIVSSWYSMYDAIKQLLSHQTKLSEITFVLGCECLNHSEIAYLEEYLRFMQPIAEGLDFLQKEDDAYFGYLVPTVLTMKAKIKRFASFPEAKYLNKITTQVEEALVAKFKPIFLLEPIANDVVVAAITCPTLKLINCTKLLRIWQETAPFCSVTTLSAIFMQVVQKSQPQVDTVAVNRSGSALLNHPFFDFPESDHDDLSYTGEIFNYSKELSNFCLDTDNTISCLHKYPLIKRMFCKLNTPLSSGAPVEKMFNFTGISNMYHGYHLMGNHFQRLVLAKANEKYFK